MKRFFSFLIAVLIFVLNCLPVFALESYTLDCFSAITYIQDDTGERLNFINTYKDIYPYIYYIHIAYNYSATHSRLIASTGPVEITAPSSRDIAFVNNGTENVTIISHNSMFNNIIVAAGETSANIRYHSITGTKGMYDDTGLLIYNGDCVNSTHCSPDIYVEFKEDIGDYEEDGVVIKGLTAFFNKFTSGLNDIKESILNLPSTIIQGIYDLIFPDIENMKSTFQEFVDYLDSKFGYGPLIDTLKTMTEFDEGSLAAGNVLKDFSVDVGGKEYNLVFSLPFSEMISDSARQEIYDYIRGFFFILIVIANLSDIYMLIRGSSPWKSNSGGGVGMNINWHDVYGGDV